jgi:hypothetical protein
MKNDAIKSTRLLRGRSRAGSTSDPEWEAIRSTPVDELYYELEAEGLDVDAVIGRLADLRRSTQVLSRGSPRASSR